MLTLNRHSSFCVNMVAMLLYVSAAQADVRLPDIFSDHMVVQRDIRMRVWGWAEPGEAVTVSLAGRSGKTVADKDGNWQVKLDPMKAGGPHELVVTGKNTITLKDVLLGDVWICAGQSNMEWPLSGADNGNEAVKSATNTQIRLFLLKASVSIVPANNVAKGWTWAVCTPQTAAPFSAVGYFFGKRINDETGIPMGLIGNAWGGSRIEAWTNDEGAELVPETQQIKKQIDARISKYQEQLAATIEPIGAWVDSARAAVNNNTAIPLPPVQQWPVHPRTSWQELGSIYNSRMAPWTPFAIKGVTWYQGESNGGEGESYYQKTRALIGGWRKVWDQGNFPFYFVQLANFQAPGTVPGGGAGWANLRQAQLKSLQIPATGMAVAIDVGAADDIHPRNKEDVGNRLALWALKNDYGKKDIVYSGPLYKSMVVEGDQIRIRFDCTGSGLMVGRKAGHGPAVEDKGTALKGFAIASAPVPAEDGALALPALPPTWHWANARIDGKTIIVSNPEVPDPTVVRYAFDMNPKGCNLYNKEGLPASPFRTDGD